MATRNVVPRANNEGNLGTSTTKWAGVNATALNELTLTKQTTGFTIAGGTTSKTLTVSTDFDTASVATQDDIIALSIALGG